MFVVITTPEYAPARRLPTPDSSRWIRYESSLPRATSRTLLSRASACFPIFGVLGCVLAHIGFNHRACEVFSRHPETPGREDTCLVAAGHAAHFAKSRTDMCRAPAGPKIGGLSPLGPDSMAFGLAFTSKCRAGTVRPRRWLYARGVSRPGEFRKLLSYYRGGARL